VQAKLEGRLTWTPRADSFTSQNDDPLDASMPPKIDETVLEDAGAASMGGLKECS
jgi:hypothetical protein